MSKNGYIFTARDEKYLVFTPKKVNFLFILYSTIYLLVNSFEKSTSPKIAKNALFCYSENINCISQYKLYQSLVKKYEFFNCNTNFIPI